MGAATASFSGQPATPVWLSTRSPRSPALGKWSHRHCSFGACASAPSSSMDRRPPPLRPRRVEGAPSASAFWRAVWLGHRRVQGAARRTLGAGVLLGALFWDDLRPPGGAGDSPLRLRRAKSALPLAPPWSVVWLGRFPLPLAPTLSHWVRTAVMAWFERFTPFPREGSPLKCFRVVVGRLARPL